MILQAPVFPAMEIAHGWMIYLLNMAIFLGAVLDLTEATVAFISLLYK